MLSSFILLSSIIIYLQFYCTIVTSNTDKDNNNNNNDFIRDNLVENERIIANVQLIYEFTIKFKQISRLSLLSCSKTESELMNNNNENENKNENLLNRNLLDILSLTNFTTNKKIYNRVNIISTMLKKLFINQKHENFPKGIFIKILQIDNIIKNNMKYVLDMNDDDECTSRITNHINKTDDNNKCNHDNHKKNSYKKIFNMTIENFLKYEIFRQIVVIDLSCGINLTRKILELASNIGMFNSSYHWLLVEDYVFNRPNEVQYDTKYIDKQEYQDVQAIKNFLSGLNININTEFIVATKKIDHHYLGDYYQLYDIWNPGWQFGGKLNITNVGIYNHHNGLKIYDWYKLTTTVIRRMDMKNVRIRCMVVVIHKFYDQTLENYLNSERDTHLDSGHRFNFKLISHVRDIFNFSIELYRTNSWGYLRKNGTFDGMIGALARHEVDIGGSPAFFRIERAKVIDYTIKTWAPRPCFIFRRPKNYNPKRLIFLQPFSNGVWISIFVCGLIAIISGWYMHYVELYSSTSDTTKDVGTFWYKLYHRILQCRQLLFNKRKTFQLCNKSKVSTIQENENYWNFNELRNNNNNNKDINIRNVIVIEENQGDKNNNNKDFHNNGNIKKNHKINMKMKNINKKNSIEMKKKSLTAIELLFDMIMFFIAAFCMQGLPTKNVWFAGRLMILTILFLVFFIYQFYSASIVGTLLSDSQTTINQLHDLINTSYELGIEDIPYTRDFFHKTTDPDAIYVYQRIGGDGENNINDNNVNKENGNIDMKSSKLSLKKKMNKNSSWLQAEDGMRLVKKGGYAFHVEVAAAYKIIRETFTEKEICELTEIQLFPPQKMGSIVQKGSPLRKIITYGLIRTEETGLMDRQTKFWHSPKPRCVKQIQPEDLSVDMQTFMSAILILIFGFVASIIILVFEFMHHFWIRLL